MALPRWPDGCSIRRCCLPHFSRPVPREAAISASPDRRPDLATLVVAQAARTLATEPTVRANAEETVFRLLAGMGVMLDAAALPVLPLQ
jgi:hypothetical protein